MAGWHGSLQRLVDTRIGIDVPETQLLRVIYPYIERRTAELGLPDADALMGVLWQQGDDAEFRRFVDAVTIGETSFYRHGDQLDAVCDEAARLHGLAKRPIEIWTAGCSTGEEPYTLAMLLGARQIPYRILATDLNPWSVDTSRKANHYSQWSTRRLPAALKNRYLEPSGPRTFQVVEALKQHIRFQQHNLVTQEYPTPADAGFAWDFILCRNVFLYFSKPTIEEVLARFAEVLTPQGTLWLGPSDLLVGFEHPLERERVGTAYGYRRVAGVEPRSMSVPPGSYEVAVEALRGGVIEAGRGLLEDCLKVDPDDIAATLTLGNVCLKRHEFTEAQEHYARAIELHHGCAEAHYLQATVRRKIGAVSDAKRDLEMALRFDPSFWPARLKLGGIQERAGELDVAIRSFETVVEQITAGADIQMVSYGGIVDEPPDPKLAEDSARIRIKQLKTRLQSNRTGTF